MASIACNKVSKTFGYVVALKNANIAIKDHEIRGILGGNGSGKSTLVKILGGAIKPNSGNVEIDGKVFTSQSPVMCKKNGIVITSQELSLFSNLSVEVNLMICTLPKKGFIFVNNEEIYEKSHEVMNMLKIGSISHKNVEDLSTDQQYLVEYAKALVQKPKILFIDEITSALYCEEVEIVKESLFALKEQGCAIGFISHRMPEVFSICDSVTVMRNGETIDTFLANEKNEEELLSLMSGRDISRVTCATTGGQNCEIASKGDKVLLSAKGIKISKHNSTVDLDIKHGEIIGIAGLQGHGQSELVRKLYGMLGPVEFFLDGKLKRITNPQNAVKDGMAFISGDRESEGVFSGRSVRENLNVVSGILVKIGSVSESALLKSYGVVLDSPRQAINTLSGGNQQKVVIGRWTAARPKIILADDPTKGIDVQARRDVHKILRELANNGASVLMVSSDNEELVELTKDYQLSHIYIMYEGNIIKKLADSDITVENIVSASNPMEVSN